LKKAEELNPGHFLDIEECLAKSYKNESSVFDLFSQTQMQKISTAPPQVQVILIQEFQEAVKARQVAIEKDFVAMSLATPNPTHSTEENAINRGIASLSLKQISRSKIAEAQGATKDHNVMIGEHEGVLETIDLMNKAIRRITTGQASAGESSAQESQSLQILRIKLKEDKKPTYAKLASLLKETNKILNSEIKGSQDLDKKLDLSKENIAIYKRIIEILYRSDKAGNDFSKLHSDFATLYEEHKNLLIEKFNGKVSSETKLNLVKQIQKAAKTIESLYLTAAKFCQDEMGQANYKLMSSSAKSKFQAWHEEIVKPFTQDQEKEAAAAGESKFEQVENSASSEQLSAAAGGHNVASDEDRIKFESQVSGAIVAEHD